MSESFDLPINFSDRDEKREFINRVMDLSGWKRVKISNSRRTMSYQQQKYYFAAHIKLIHGALIRRRWNGSEEFVHEMMKEKFLKREEINPVTGEIFYRTPSLLDLTTIQMMDYMEQVKEWAFDNLDITVPPPELYYDHQERVA